MRPYLAELRHCRDYEEKKYIACLEWNFAWTPNEIDQVKTLWKRDLPIWDISQEVKRPQEEIAVLVMDLRQRGEIEKRGRGVL